ncbi:hypothetical protein K474DRAFT_1667248 [Panus rudis PR-1116 ss-1]|nr:hypothetical protein K474DRAFT_1667248 [Panus rudis PR-1116 ss-1]
MRDLWPFVPYPSRRYGWEQRWKGVDDALPQACPTRVPEISSIQGSQAASWPTFPVRNRPCHYFVVSPNDNSANGR